MTIEPPTATAASYNQASPFSDGRTRSATVIPAIMAIQSVTELRFQRTPSPPHNAGRIDQPVAIITAPPDASNTAPFSLPNTMCTWHEPPSVILECPHPFR